MIAVRGRNWVIRGRLPRSMRDRLLVEVDFVEEEAYWEWDTTLQKNQRVVNLHKGTEIIDLGVPSADGLVFPRCSFSVEEMRKAGFDVREPSSFTPPVWKELQEIGERIQMRPGVQEEALASLMKNDGGFVMLAPGKGKTVIALKAAAMWGQKTLVFVDNGGLYTQWIERVREFWGLSDADIGAVQGPIEKWAWESHPICVAMFDSFHNQFTQGRVPPDFFSSFGTVIWDEAQLAKAPTRAPTLSLFPGRRMGLSATPGRDGSEEILYHHIGRPEVIDLKSDLTPACHFVAVPMNEAPKIPAWGGGMTVYGKMLSACLGTAKKEPDFLYYAKLRSLLEGLLEEGRRTIAIIARTRSGRMLEDQIEDMVFIDQEVGFRVRGRELNRTDLVGVTPQIGERALDRKNLDTLVMAFPVGRKAIDRAQQAAGRVLRACDGKSTPRVYVLFPDIPAGRSLAQSNEAIFEELGYHIATPASRRIDIPRNRVKPRPKPVPRRLK